MDEMNRKPQALQQALVNRMGPSLHDNTRLHVAQPMLPKMNELCQSFASFTMFTRPLANRLLLLQVSQKLFAEKTLPQPARGRKCFPRIHLILKRKFLCYRNKQTYFSLAKNVLSVIVPILINKDVFEHSYYDLKFTVQNHNHSSTNLLQIF